MLAKKFRLNKNQIAYIRRKGKETRSRLFIVLYKENDQEYSRFAVITSTKLAPKAVERNKLKRRIHEAIRLQESSKHLDIVLIPKKLILDKSYQEISEDIATIL